MRMRKRLCAVLKLTYLHACSTAAASCHFDAQFSALRHCLAGMHHVSDSCTNASIVLAAQMAAQVMTQASPSSK